MKILFITFGELSLGGNDMRATVILQALAEAGYQVDVVAARSTIPEHTNIRFLVGGTTKCIPRRILRKTALFKAIQTSYDVVHAVDDAGILISRICKIRKIKLVYDASRRFTSSIGCPPSRFFKLFPSYAKRVEKALLNQAVTILTPSNILSGDLKNLEPNASIVQIEDVPIQSFFSKGPVDPAEIMSQFEERPSAVVVTSIFPDSEVELNKFLMAARKVVDAIPKIAFFIKGVKSETAEAAAANLDIRDRCRFLELDEMQGFLSALDIADVALFIPRSKARCIHAELYTMLRSPAPIVAVGDVASSEILNANNCVQVLPDSDSIAEGLLQVIQEPLLSIGLAVEGQKLVAKNFSASSFKHKIRMAYHEVLTNE